MEQRVVDKWILKTLRNRSGEVLSSSLGSVRVGMDLIVNGLVHKAADHFIFHTVTDNIPVPAKYAPKTKEV